jgi:hypothetical protein
LSSGAELDGLIARQWDYFTGRGEAVGWQIRGHDETAELSARLRAAGFVAGPEQTVLVGLTADLAMDPVRPAVRGLTREDIGFFGSWTARILLLDVRCRSAAPVA